MMARMCGRGRYLMGSGKFCSDRRGAVSVMFAAATVPMIGLVGLAVDFGIWNQTNSTLSVAANVAALSAVKITANAQLAGDANAVTEGQTAGKQWFAVEVGSSGKIGPEGVNNQATTVKVTGGATVTAQVSYTGTVPSIFGGILFGIANYPISGSAVAQVTSAPYLNVELLLDNSSSMDIGASVTDMQRLQQISACDASNAVYSGQSVGNSQDPYSSYEYSSSNNTYAAYQDSYGTFPGPLAVPVVLTPPSPYPAITLKQGSPQPCKGFLPVQSNGTYPVSGPPCEFACHWDSSANSGAAQDLYGAARRTIGTAAPIQLRFDLVKIATQQILTTMQSDNLSFNNLNVGIFTFNTGVKQIYPASGEAGHDWATAIADVGLPPTSATASETGILPTIALRQNAGTNDNTDIITSLAQLESSYLTTSSGDGTTAATPRKVLFLITDGFMDSATFGRSAFPPALCDDFKQLNYTIYVIYTPYYPVMHQAYIDPVGGGPFGQFINGTTSDPGTLAYGLQQCASSASDYISAQSQSDLNTALQTFLKAALNSPARFTQ